MRWTVIILSLLLVVGCATVLVVEERDAKGNLIRSIRAEDYSIKTPTVTAVPSRWLTPSFVSEIFKGIIGWQSILPALTPAKPEPEPVTPTPTPTPVTPEPVTPVEPTPVTPTPTPTPAVTDTVFTKAGNLLTLDLERVPEAMNRVGIPGDANELWYSLAHVYAYGPGREMVGELEEQNPYRQQIFDWFDAEVLKVIAMMKADKNLSLIAISNDGKDRCGFRLGPAIVERVLNDPAISASRVQVGQTLSPDDY